MGSGFVLPGTQSNFLDMYNQMYQDPAMRLPTSFLPPDDPQISKYMDLATSPTGSEDLISGYVDRRPSYEEYEPGLGRKMASFLLGTLSGGGYGAAQKHLYQPLEQDIDDWTREGKGITSRARLMDAERQRELAAKKYGIQQAGQAARAEAIDTSRERTQARQMADKVRQEEESASRLEERKESRAFREDMSENLMDFRGQLRQDRLDRDRENQESRDALRTEKREKEAAEARSAENVNDRIMESVSQLGIQTKLKRGNMTTYDAATAMVYEKALQHPAFQDMIEKTRKGYKLSDDNPGRVQALRAYIQNERQKILRGDF